MIGEIKKFRDLEELSSSVAHEINRLINKVAASKGVFYLALSGGNTPRTLYYILGSTYQESIPWNAVHVFFCDERYVPHEDRESNYRMVKENMLDLIPIPQGNIHPIMTDYPDFTEAAQAYEKLLRKYFSDDGSSFDLVLLGMGKEGHTASLFPCSPVLDEKEKWAAAVEVEANPPKRITLTYPILNRASKIYFLVSGSEKAMAFKEVFQPNADFHNCPAAGAMPTNGELVWWIDHGVSRN